MLLIALLLWCGVGEAQSPDLLRWLCKPPRATATAIPHATYRDAYFVWMLPQPLDHGRPQGPQFLQRVFVGVRDPKAPVVMVTEGYGADFAAQPAHDHELAQRLGANLVVVEHRYFGKSMPDSLDYRWLDTRQAAADVHAVRTSLGQALTGPWLSTGTSKGGQAALAHRMLHPADVAATVVYGTAVKKSASISADELLRPLMESPCGKLLAALQLRLFQRKDSLLPRAAVFVGQSGLSLGDMPLETMLDYSLLELPYSFWQSGADCAQLPGAGADTDSLLRYLVRLVPPRFYGEGSRRRWQPAFHQFYHELGYYEYDIAPFRRYLGHDAYPNAYFAPPMGDAPFDRRHLQGLRDFLETPAAHSAFFIYGQNDPWALQSVVVANRYDVPGGSHRSKVADLPPDMQADLMQRLARCLGRAAASAGGR